MLATGIPTTRAGWTPVGNSSPLYPVWNHHISFQPLGHNVQLYQPRSYWKCVLGVISCTNHCMCQESHGKCILFPLLFTITNQQTKQQQKLCSLARLSSPTASCRWQRAWVTTASQRVELQQSSKEEHKFTQIQSGTTLMTPKICRQMGRIHLTWYRDLLAA